VEGIRRRIDASLSRGPPAPRYLYLTIIRVENQVQHCTLHSISNFQKRAPISGPMAAVSAAALQRRRRSRAERSDRAGELRGTRSRGAQLCRAPAPPECTRALASPSQCRSCSMLSDRSGTLLHVTGLGPECALRRIVSSKPASATQLGPRTGTPESTGHC
jgi:uncharacterized protein (TIGR03382 family)